VASTRYLLEALRTKAQSIGKLGSLYPAQRLVERTLGDLRGSGAQVFSHNRAVLTERSEPSYPAI
jgi:hypothetical protein